MKEAFKALAGIFLATLGVYVVFYWDKAERRRRRMRNKD